MKRKILAMALIAAMALPAVACAEVGGTITKSAPDDMQISTMPEGIPSYARHDAKVKDVADGEISLDIGEELPETATIDENTVVFNASGDIADVKDIKAGANVSVFVDGGAPVPAIYPAIYPASYIVIGTDDGFAGVDIDRYEESDSLGMYLNGAKDLAINVDENSTIVPVDGTKIHIDYTDLAGKELAVFYSMVTMSIPGQTYPDKIVVLKDAPEGDGDPMNKGVTIHSGACAGVEENTVNGEKVTVVNVSDENEGSFGINIAGTSLFDNAGNEIEVSDIKEGAHITAIVSNNSEAPTVEPPVYRAMALVADVAEEGNYDVDVYFENEEGLIENAEHTLALNIDDSVDIRNLTGYKADASMITYFVDTTTGYIPSLVFYTDSTKSIPAQTTPSKVIILAHSNGIDLNNVLYKVVETATGSEYNADEKLTRGMMVNALANLAGAPSDGKTDAYTDVPADAYCAPYVAWATENGMIDGFGDGTFRPNDAITREQAAKIIKNYYDYKGDGPVGAWAVRMSYADLDKVSDWALEGVMFCTMKDIVHGRTDGSFDPQANITCGEFAIMLDNIASDM